MTLLNITTKDAALTELNAAAGPGGCGCQASGSSCCQADTPALAETAGSAAAPGDTVGPAATADSAGGGVLRTSSYIIYVDLPRNDHDMLLVHGYLGAFDKVSKRIATFLRAKEDRRAPRPLYGDWAPDPVVQSAPDLPDEYVQTLLRRGYLTYLTREQELERFKHLADQLHVQQQAPTYVLMPTYNCNLRCFYCFQDHMRTKPEFEYLLKRMTHPMVDRIFDAMPQIEALHGIAPEDGYRRPIMLFGGEPLLRDNRDLVEHILKRAKDGGTDSLSAVTNGTDLDHYQDLLGKDGLSSLQITLDGIPAEHDKRRIYADGRGSFDAIAANVTLALERGASVSVRLNVDRGNIGQLPELAQIFTDRGWAGQPQFIAYATVISASNDKTDRATTFTSWELDQAMAELLEAHPVMAAIEPKDSTLRQRALSIFHGGQAASLQASFCSAHSGMYVIDRFGDLYACWERTGNPNTRIGRITPESTIEMNDMMTSMWRTRTVTSNPVCQQCRYALYCGGGCAVLAEGRKGRIDRNFCDGYGFRFRAMVAEAYQDFRDGTGVQVPENSAAASMAAL